jgi:hypothetical protein
MEIPVFRKGNVYMYKVREDCPAGWSKSHSFRAASIFATAQSRGYTQQESEGFAEMYVFKQIFPGMMYEKSLEQTLQTFINHEETT